MGKIRKILGFLSFLFVCIYATISFGEGYVCDTNSKVYTSCSANYYMSGGVSAGNSCTACGANSSTPSENTSNTCTCDYGHTATGTPNGVATSTTGCNPIRVTITYNCGTGTGTKPANETATYGQTFTPATNTCTKTGYHFIGWNDGTTNHDAGVAFTSLYTFHKTFTAQWVANTYTVNFNTNNATSGSPNVASVTCTYDQNCPTFATQGSMFKTNSIFDDVWNTNSNGTGTRYTAGTSTAINLTTTNSDTIDLYAEWSTCSYTNGTNANTTVTGVTDNRCQYEYTCAPGYNNSGVSGGSFQGEVATASSTSPSCNDKNTYTITVKAGHGVSTVAASGWTGTGTGTMSKTFSYLDTIDLSSVVTPTRKNGYSGTSYAVTAGTGSISGTTFTVGAGNGTITLNATTINTPSATISGGATKVYNYEATTLTAGNPGSYDSGVTVKYSFGYSTSANGTYGNWTTASTTNTLNIAKDAFRGTRYYKVKVIASDGTLPDAEATSSYTTMTLENKAITFDANDGTRSGTSPLYVSYDNVALYTTATGTTTGTLPTASKSTNYVWSGWYTGKTTGSQIYDANGTITSSTVSGYTSDSKWVATSDQTLYAHYEECSCTKGSNIDTCTITAVTNNKCQYSYSCSYGYTNNTNGVFEGAVGVGNNTSPNCTKNAVSTITLDSKYYTSSTATSGTNADTAAAPTPLYLWYGNGWYTNPGTTTSFTGLATIPAYSNYVFGGFYDGKAGTGTKIIDSDGMLASGVTNTQFATSAILYAKWTQCSCTNGTGATDCSATVSNNKCNYTWSCSTQYWHATQSASAQETSFTATCNSCPTNYNDGSDGDRKAKTSCYANKTAICTQNECSKPTNCETVTCTASCSCSPAATYKQYSDAEGTGNGTTVGTTSQECTKSVASVTAATGYYVNDKSCAKCSDKNASYPYSVGGNSGGWTACYSGNQSRPWSGSETPCVNPDLTGCASVTCESCSNQSCTYTAYLNAAGTGDGDVKSGCSTNDSACQQGVAELSAKENFWVSGTTSCPACNVSFIDEGSDNCDVEHATAATQSFTRTCYHQTSSGGNIAESACTGTQSCGKKTLGTCYVTSCENHYHKNATTNATSCQPDVYTITLDDTTGSGGMGSIKEVYADKWTNSTNTTITKVTKPSRTNWIFLGYYDAATGGSQIINSNGDLPSANTITSSTTLYAHWSQGTFTCTAGKSASGANCAAGSYCPGGTVNAGDHDSPTIGCQRACPSDGSNAVSSPESSSLITACFTTRTGTAIADGHGGGDQVCNYVGTAASGSYTNCKSVKIKYCDAGYYRAANDAAKCEKVDTGFYSPAPLSTIDDPASVVRNECPNDGTTASQTASLVTECYITDAWQNTSHGGRTARCYYTVLLSIMGITALLNRIIQASPHNQQRQLDLLQINMNVQTDTVVPTTVAMQKVIVTIPVRQKRLIMRQV